MRSELLQRTVFFICIFCLPLHDDVKPLSLISFSLKSIIGMVLCTPKVVSADYDILAILEVGNIS